MNIESFFKISYGLYLVSTELNNKINGYIANTVFQITSEPARFAISCHKDNYTTPMIKESGKFAFMILEKDTNQNIISEFGYKSGKDNNKFDGLDYFISDLGNPILNQNVIAYFDCELEQTIDIGTHNIFIGQLKANEVIDLDKDPLTYADYRNLRNGKAPKNAPTYVDPGKLSGEPKPMEKSSSILPKYECLVCGHIYDPELGDEETGIAAGTSFEDLPDDWCCPVCGVGKEDFQIME